VYRIFVVVQRCNAERYYDECRDAILAVSFKSRFQMFSFKNFRFKKTVLRNRWKMKDLSFNAKKITLTMREKG
jgi:hypothetical protein